MCDCKICQRIRSFEEHKKILEEQGLTGSAKFLEQIFDIAMHEEENADYYRAIVDGSWPTADERIAQYREKRRRTECQAH